MSETDKGAFQHIGSGWVDQSLDQYAKDTDVSSLRKNASRSDIQPLANNKGKSYDDDFDGLSCVRSDWSLTSASTIHSESDVDDIVLPGLGECNLGSFGRDATRASAWPWSDTKQTAHPFSSIGDVHWSDHRLPTGWLEAGRCARPEPPTNVRHSDFSFTTGRFPPPKGPNVPVPGKSKTLIGKSMHLANKRSRKHECVYFKSVERSCPYEITNGDTTSYEQSTTNTGQQRRRSDQASLPYRRRKTNYDPNYSFGTKFAAFNEKHKLDTLHQSVGDISRSRISGKSSESTRRVVENESMSKHRYEEDVREINLKSAPNLGQYIRRSGPTETADFDEKRFDLVQDVGNLSSYELRAENSKIIVQSPASEDGLPNSGMTSSSTLSFAGMHHAAYKIYDDLSPFTKSMAVELAQSLLVRYSQKYDYGMHASDWAKYFRLEGTLEAIGQQVPPPTINRMFTTCGQRTPPDSTQMSNSEAVISLTTSSTSTQSNLIRRKHGRGDEHMDSDDDMEDKRSKKYKLSETNVLKLFACPFAKFDKERYSERNLDEAQYRKCGTCMLREISRLKQHLYRVHRRPEYCCPVCNQACASQSLLDEHIRRRDCVLREVQLYGEKMTIDQMKGIKQRNKKETPVQNWFGIFKILFPNAPLPISPYAGESSNDAVLHFVEFFRTVGPETMFELIRERQEQNLMQPFSTSMQVIVDEAFEIAAPALLTALESQSRMETSTQPTPQQIQSMNGLTGNDVFDMRSRCPVSESDTLEFEQPGDDHHLQSVDNDRFGFRDFDPSLAENAFDAYDF